MQQESYVSRKSAPLTSHFGDWIVFHYIDEFHKKDAITIKSTRSWPELVQISYIGPLHPAFASGEG